MAIGIHRIRPTRARKRGEGPKQWRLVYAAIGAILGAVPLSGQGHPVAGLQATATGAVSADELAGLWKAMRWFGPYMSIVKFWISQVGREHL